MTCYVLLSSPWAKRQCERRLSQREGEREKDRERKNGKAQRQHNRWSQRQQLSKRCAQKLSWLSRVRALALPVSHTLSLSLSWVRQFWALRKSARETQSQHILTYITYTRRCRWCWRRRRHFNFAVFFFRTLRLCIYFQLHFQLNVRASFNK